jgi:hypothetical protein
LYHKLSSIGGDQGRISLITNNYVHCRKIHKLIKIFPLPKFFANTIILINL